MKKIIFISLSFTVLFFAFNSCKHEVTTLMVSPTPLPGPVPNNGVCFQSEILPLFQSNCAKSGCHDATTHTKELILDSYVNIIRRDIVPGNADASKLENTKVLCISRDLPFAQKRFCGAEGLENVINLSDFNTGNFGKDYGLECKPANAPSINSSP